jgi:hypothetical protein
MKHVIKGFLIVLMWGAVLNGGVILAATSPAEVNQALSALSLTNAEEIMQAFEIGFSQGSLYPEEALHLVKRLTVAEGSKAEKEEILLTIAHALEDDLPVSLLVGKIEEGLARKVPLTVVLNGSGGQHRILGLVQRAALLGAVRDLLYSKRIFGAPEGAKAVSTCLPNSRFDSLVNEIAAFLADYIEGGGSPLEGYRMFQEMGARLHSLAGLKEPVIPMEDVELVLERVGPGDLTNIVLRVLEY